MLIRVSGGGDALLDPLANADDAVGRRASTSEDVARLAGVSRPTVSLVLSGRGDRIRVAAATQQRVFSAAEALGYVPNFAARSLRTRRSRVITVIAPSLENPFFAEVIGAVKDAATARKYSTNVVIARNGREEASAIAHVLAGSADAVVIATHFAGNLDALRQLAKRRIPSVVLQQVGAGFPIPSVAVDLEMGGYVATRHLIGLGHRRIAHVTPPGAGAGRRDGYLRALREADIAPDPALIVETPNTLAGGSEAASALLAKPATAPTAVFAYNDQLAFGLLHGARRSAIRVPDDLAVVGFDNTVSAAFSNPELTTVAHERNRLTVEMLFALLDGAAVASLRQVVPVALVVRESCGTPRTERVPIPIA